MVVLIVDAHGYNTPGKKSPDGKFKEWEWSKNFCHILEGKLKSLGIETAYINPEDNDISISISAARANVYAKKHGSKNCVLISPHVDAGPAKGWQNATGFTSFVHNNASNASCRLAKLLTEKMYASGFRGNRAKPAEGFKRANYGILRETMMPAVLTENLFMTNQGDVDRLQDPEVVEKIANAHVEAIKQYIDEKLYL